MKRRPALLFSMLFSVSSGMLVALPYQLDLQPPAGGQDVFVAIEVPVGVTPSDLSHGGVFDLENRLMKWGPLSVAEVPALGFDLTAGSGALAISAFPADATAQNTMGILADSDGDGLSNDFEARYSVSDPDADDDGDGFDNLAEQNLGTHPRDAASRLFARSTVENPAGEFLEIRIPAEVGAAGLRVESSPSLTDVLWRNVTFATRVDGDEIVVEVEFSPLTGGKNFFRVLR